MKQIQKNVFVVFYSGEKAKSKIMKICEAFGANLYQFPEEWNRQRWMIEEVIRFFFIWLHFCSSRGHYLQLQFLLLIKIFRLIIVVGSVFVMDIYLNLFPINSEDGFHGFVLHFPILAWLLNPLSQRSRPNSSRSVIWYHWSLYILKCNLD